MSPEIYEDLWRTIINGNVWQNELLNKRKNGELFWEDTIIFPIKDEKGEIIFYSAIKSNLTKQKKLEKELRQSREEAQRNEKIKTAFLNNVSHEVNTPLNAIYGFSEILKSKFNKNDTEYEQASYIFNHSKILLKLFKDIMDYSAFEAGNIDIKKEEINIYQVLEKISSKYNVKIIGELKKDIEIIVNVNNDFKEAILISDKEWTTRILEELISNSIKFTIKGAITVGYEINHEHIIFYVNDTGVGVPENEKDSILNSFTHGENHFVSLHRGTGLGLNIINSLVKHLGGKMWFESKEGKGSTFYFSLPSIDVKNYILNNKTVDFLPYSELLKGKKIIIAEDNDNSFEHLKSHLTKEAKEVSRVKSENELIEMLNKNSKTYNLILYDVYIPKLNNISFLQTIKSSYPDILIVGMFSGDFELSAEPGNNFDATIKKPFSKKKLYEILASILSKK